MTLHSLCCLKTFSMAYFTDSFMTFRLQQANSTTQWTREHITGKILRVIGYTFIHAFTVTLMLLISETEDNFTRRHCFCWILRFFILSFGNNGSVFRHFVRNNQAEITLVSATQLGLEPLPTQPRAHVTESLAHSFSVFLYLSYTHIYTHTHTRNTVSQQTASTRAFGGTGEILYHSNTIETLPTAETKKAKAGPWQSKL